mgnify:CR=1 FL=1
MEESRGALLFQKVCHILNIILKVAVMVIIAFPFYWMVSTSLKDYTEALQFPPTLFPSSLHWENYAHVFEIVPIGLYFRNSVVVSLCVLVLQYLIIVPAAYSFARHEYFGKNIFFGIVLLGLMIPQQITFLPVYLENKILKVDPFQVLDQNGVGQLIQMAVEKGRSVRPDLKCGICGEHGGEPSSVKFCHRVGLNYVSCSPFRVPIARLAAAQAAIKNPRK